MTSEYDLVVVGAGPAGLAAAVAAGEHGLRVALSDAGQQPGGQFWRHPDEQLATEEPRGQHGWRRFTDLRDRLYRLEAEGTVARLAGRQVWFIEGGDGGFRLHLTSVVGGTAPSTVAAARVVLCPGGHDRQLPVPGWDLPGVMTAGGAQALLKGHGTVAGRRVVVAGTGPFLLPVATGLADAGADVAAICESGSPTGWVRTPMRSIAVPSKAYEAVTYTAQLARHRVPYRTRTVITRVHGEHEVDRVSLSRLDRRGRLRPDAETTDLDVDLVAFGWGFTPSLELPLAIGVTTRVDADESLVVAVDRSQRTSVVGAYAAGEVTGVGGAVLAQAEGELAGLTVAGDAGRPVVGRRARRLQRAVTRGRSFATAMHLAHPVPKGWQDWLREDTLLCRCEEVAVGDVRTVRDSWGATDARTVKSLARPGMGWCQGRVCGFATAKIAAEESPLGPEDLAPISRRPLATPVRLGDLAAEPD